MPNNQNNTPNVLEFKDKFAFRKWLEEHHSSTNGVDLYLYKKGYYHLGLSYDDAVRTALCFGWIDAVTHSHNEKKFRQYFAPRRKGSNWSLSNIIRMKELIDTKEMTAFGLQVFDLALLNGLDERISKDRLSKSQRPIVPEFFKSILLEKSALDLFHSETNSAQKRYIQYILDAKKEETKIRRCYKIVGILQGEKNNL